MDKKLLILAKNDHFLTKQTQTLCKNIPTSSKIYQYLVITTSECLQSKQTLCTIVTVSTEVAQQVGPHPKIEEDLK